MRLQLPSFSFRLPSLASQGLSLFQERSGSPVRHIVLLAAWGILVFALSLGTRVASDQFAHTLRDGLPPETGLRMTVSGVAPLAFPPGASADTLSLADAKGAQFIKLSNATVRVSLMSLLTCRLGVRITGQVGDGILNATVATGFPFDTTAFKIVAEANSLPLDRIPAFKRFDKSLKGTVDGTLRLAAPMDRLHRGDLKADLSATGLDAKNFIPILKPKRLPLLDIRLVAEATDGILAIDQFQATGKDMFISGQGEAIVDQETPGASKLDMAARLGMPASMVIRQLIRPDDYKRLQRGKDIDIHLSGTVDRPRINRR